MHIHRIIASLILSFALLAGCGSDDVANSSTTTAAPTTQDPAATTSTSTDDPSTTTTTSTTDSTTTTTPITTTDLATLEQPAVWPASDVVFSDPTEAAADFVSNVLGVPPELGEFKQGDSRSGEIDVLSSGEGAGPAVLRSTLILRQLGQDDGWFVLAAVNENNTIASPQSGAEVAAGPIEITGQGRGFEASLVVEAFVAGDAGGPLDQQITQGGSAADTVPYSVTLDLTGLEPGDTVLLLVRGGVGLETDPGEFSAIPVTII